MAHPDPYTRGYSFTPALTPTNAPEAGARLDAELDKVAVLSTQTRASLARIQRSDGALGNTVVTPDSLSAATRALLGSWTPRGSWVTGRAYAVRDLVGVAGGRESYLCAAAHTSGTFSADLAAGRWVKIGSSSLQATAADFGATGDGTTDDTAALQAWLDAGGGFLPAGTYKITSTLLIGNGSILTPSTLQNIVLESAGLPGAGAQELGPSGFGGTATFRWAGATGGTMLSIRGPITNSVSGFQLDGNGTAGVGFLDTHSVGGEMADIVIRNVTASFGRIRAYDSPTDCYTTAGTGRVYRNVRGWDPVAGTGFVGLDVGNDTISSGGGTKLDVARITFIGCEFTRPAGAGNDTLTLRFVDNITFIRCFFYGPSTTTGNAIAVRCATGNAIGAYYPEVVLFEGCVAVGAFYSDPSWDIASTAGLNRGLIFHGLHDGDNNNQVPDEDGWSGWTSGGMPFGIAGGTLARQRTQVQVTGTTSATNAFTYAVLPYTLSTYRRLRMVAHGTFQNNTGSSRNVQWYVGYAASTLHNATISVPASASFGAWTLTVDFGAFDNSTAKQSSQSRLVLYTAGSTGGTAQAVLSDTGAHNSALTVDSTAGQTLALDITPGNSGVVVNTNSVVVEVV